MLSHRDGFHHRLPFVAEEEQCHLCRHRQPLESFPLLSSEGLHFRAQLADLYTARVVYLHGIPKKIRFDRGSLSTSKFWQAFQKAIGTTMLVSPAYPPQTVAG